MGRIKYIHFTDLSANYSISVTGKSCALNCQHCNKKFLGSMGSLDGIIKPGIKSILISGGCDGSGKVPLLRFAKKIKVLKDKYKINAHAGLVSKSEAKVIGSLVDIVSFDFVCKREIIREIYKSDKKPLDYYRSLTWLQKESTVVPHLTLGLWRGRIDWEYKAVNILVNKFNFPKIVFNIFIPLPGTELANQQFPTIKSIKDFFIYLKENYPKLDKRLGCMRSGGLYRSKVDQLALLSGFNVITKPSVKTVLLASRTDCQIFWHDQCCVFI